MKSNATKTHLEKVVNACVQKIDYEARKVFFVYNNKDYTLTGNGYCNFDDLGDMNSEDIANIFWDKSSHLCLMSEYDPILDMYKLDYGPLHPEIYLKPFKIIPTINHNRNLFRHLRMHMDQYIFTNKEKDEKDSNDIK